MKASQKGQINLQVVVSTTLLVEIESLIGLSELTFCIVFSLGDFSKLKLPVMSMLQKVGREI